MSLDPTRRFSSRVADYVRYRPSYPPEVVRLLALDCGLSTASRIADIGSGTGLASALFLDHGCEVGGGEPNAEMRGAGERELAGYARFHSVDARAEATTLASASVEFVVAGQAFHWFDPAAARREFERILAPGGHIVLVWNERAESLGFQADYDAIVRRYASETSRIDRDAIDCVFSGCLWRYASFANAQELDLAALEGRLAPSSYAPAAGTKQRGEMLDALAGLFEKYQTGGRVTLRYDTRVYYR